MSSGTNGNGNGNGRKPAPPPTTTTTTTNGNGQGKGKGRGNGPAASGSGRGIVQSVSTARLVLTQLDGSNVSIAVSAATRVFVDGRRARISDVEPGYVVSTAWAAGTARVVQAFDLSSTRAVEIGTVRSVSTNTVVVRRSDGRIVVLHVGYSTRVLLDGDATTLRTVRPGDTVVFTAADAARGKPASELRFLRPV